MSVLVSQEDFEALAWNYFEHASADGVVHAEVFFDPQAHMSRSVPFDVVLSGFKAARHRALKELSISSQLICCFLRHLPVGDSFAAFELPEVQAGMYNHMCDPTNYQVHSVPRKRSLSQA